MNNKSLKETTKKEKLSYMRTCYGYINVIIKFSNYPK